MISSSAVMVNGGTFVTITQNRTKRGIDLLMEWVATGAFHNSDELYDVPKCHPHTRVAVLNDIMKWVNESEAQEDFILWLFGPAGAGKSAIAKKLAELAAEKGLLIGTFFFSRTSSMRNVKDRLVPTLAYQMAVSIPATRTHIEAAIERDPAIFHKCIQTQIDTLLIKPFQSASTQIIPLPKLIIIDGLDECNNSRAQVEILDAISRSFPRHKLPIICLVVSRPEPDIVASFKGKEPLKNIHLPLSLNDTYNAYDDIGLFFSDKFQDIRCSHRLRSSIPIPWPTEESLETLVRKSSGQFIFADTVMKFVESSRHQPVARLNTILGISSPSPGTKNPFAELDALYKQILSSVDDIQLTLRVLSLYIMAPNLMPYLRRPLDRSVESFLSLEEGDLDRALIDLSSIVSYHESSGNVEILHASFVDFLSDKRRSNEFYLDMASTRRDFTCRTLQYVKGPDGIQAGDIGLFEQAINSASSILNDEFRSDILNFDFDAFVTAVIELRYEKPSHFSRIVFSAFPIWIRFLNRVALEDRDKHEALYRCNISFVSRVQKYQSDWRLQLLLAVTAIIDLYSHAHPVPECRCLDILLGMDNHDLHLVDRDALDLRHSQGWLKNYMTSLDGDRCAFAALHCMRFLCNPPKYFKGNDSPSPEKSLMYFEWKATCDMALGVLCEFLKGANTSSELVEFIINHDIESSVRNIFVFHVSRVDVHILAFLGRANVCVNWRIISAIRKPQFATNDEPSSKSEGNRMGPDEQETRLIRERVDQCCNHVYHHMRKY